MSEQSLRLAFAGTPEFAAQHLAALITSQHDILAVYTQPDRPAGRGKKLQASPVKQLAESAGIQVRQPATLRDPEVQGALAELQADVLVVVAYGLILPQEILDIPPFGCLNVHASLLPRWRGAAPIQRAIEAGDDSTGVTIMQMDAGLDTGAMLATAHCPITSTTSAADLLETLSESGPPLLLEVLADLPSYRAAATVQEDAEATYASKIEKAEAQIDWQQPAALIDRQIRAFNPFPVCYSTLAGERVKIWQASAVNVRCGPEQAGTIVAAGRDGVAVSCGEGELLIQRLQLPGGKPMAADAVLNSRRDQFAVGQCFDSSS